MIIAIDAFGGDNAPDEIIKGCALALRENDDFSLLICGDKEKVSSLCNENGMDLNRIEIRHASEIIGMDESPVLAIKKKKQSSMVLALDAVANEEAQAFISAGNTGAVLAGATLIIKRVKGITRPALAPLMPTSKGTPVLLIDCGANVDCKPEYLSQFALMGSIYMNDVQGIKNPKIGLVNNGAEELKGNALTKEAYQLLKDMPINFAGNVEARHINSGDVDVVVCDGFVGNIVLKQSEGIASTLFAMMKKEFTSGLRSKIGAMLLKPALRRIKKQMDYTEYGGAPFLGVNGSVIKAHGSSNAKAFKFAINQARGMIVKDTTIKIKQGVLASQVKKEDND